MNLRLLILPMLSSGFRVWGVFPLGTLTQIAGQLLNAESGLEMKGKVNRSFPLRQFCIRVSCQVCFYQMPHVKVYLVSILTSLSSLLSSL